MSDTAKSRSPLLKPDPQKYGSTSTADDTAATRSDSHNGADTTRASLLSAPPFRSHSRTSHSRNHSHSNSRPHSHSRTNSRASTRAHTPHSHSHLFLPTHSRSDSSLSASSYADSEPELTEAEREEYERGLLTWDRAMNWRFWVRWEWVGWYFVAGIVVVGVVLVAVFHRVIIHELMPLVYRLRRIPFGWIIPLFGIVVLSFPPLFGNDILIIVCGVVWGITGGFAIVAAGTIIGEMACFTMFKTCCRTRAHRLARSSLNYACLSRVIEGGGLFVAWLVRMSVIPTHVSTAIFAVCGLNYPTFFISLILSLPKQFTAVYVGVVVADDSNGPDRVISHIVLAITLLFALFSVLYVHKHMLRVRKRVLLEMRDDLARRGVREPLPENASDWSIWDAIGGSERRVW